MNISSNPLLLLRLYFKGWILYFANADADADADTDADADVDSVVAIDVDFLLNSLIKSVNIIGKVFVKFICVKLLSA